MEIRPYTPDDDAALLAIEYRSPRGASAPFVHYRRRFADRSAIFADSRLFVLDVEGVVAGCIGIALKPVLIGGIGVLVGYIFDLRVSPDQRKAGYGNKLTEFAETFVQTRGAVGLYGAVVTTNMASLTLLERRGYQRIRQLLYLEYEPVPACVPGVTIDFDHEDDMVRFSVYSERDFYTDEVLKAVAGFGYCRWGHDSDSGFASLSAFDISKVYRQVALDDLRLPVELLERQSRTIRLFHPQGALESPDLFQNIFETARYAVLDSGYYGLSMVVDAEETLPLYIFEQAEKQKRYWLTFKTLDPEFDPVWSSPFYIDPREV